MKNVKEALEAITADKSFEECPDQALASYRLWFELDQIYSQIPSLDSDSIFDTIWKCRARDTPNPTNELKITTDSLILRFASDVESDAILAPHCAGLGNRIYTRLLENFLEIANVACRDGCKKTCKTPSCPRPQGFSLSDVNLLAHCANLGYICEAATFNHILESLISQPDHLCDYRVSTFSRLFKTAGATFEERADHSVIDLCFKRLRGLRKTWLKVEIDELVQLRKGGWKDLPPPTVLKTGGLKLIATDQTYPSETPVVISPGLPMDLGPLPRTTESVTAGTKTTLAFPTITRPMSISDATLVDFTTADTSDDKSCTDPKAIIPHGTFYLEDGNVEVLCESTLFRVHAIILSFHSHSPALLEMFAPASLAMAESPNGCPRIISPDTAVEFTTLLEMIYLPSFLEQNKAPGFDLFSFLLRVTSKYELPAARSQLLETIHDAYPETFEEVIPTKPLGENVFSGHTPHPNQVLNLFLQQKLTSTLPMAYYMAARGGPNSLMAMRPKSVMLPRETLQSVIKGFEKLQEFEFKETRRLILGSKPSQACSSINCPSRKTRDQRASDAHQKIIDRIANPSKSVVEVLQVPSLSNVCGGPGGFCKNCIKGWEAGHTKLREKAWKMLPDAFDLKTGSLMD